MPTQTPIAFLLVKFQGSNDEPMTRAAATQMCTAAGRGTMNVVDWFDDNTHGQVDMTGNEVFGWLQLTETASGYGTKRANGTYGRSTIIDLGRAAAAAAGINLSRFTAVVVITNVEVDLFGGNGYVCCTAATAGKKFSELQVAPSILCQELIHALGIFGHARRHGSDNDYADPYDVMSMFNASPGHHPTNPNVPVGPGLNAAFMKRCGWLDATRAAPIGQKVVLRPLHRRDLPGPLYSMVGEYFVEYRPSRRWDTGFSSVVLVHYVANDTSYLVAELAAGSEFSGGAQSPSCSIKVDAIDDGAQTATITLRQWHWTNMGKPSGVNLRAMMGAVTVMDTPTSPQRSHVFAEGNDYNLWCFWSDSAQWHWTNMGKPPGVNLRATMGTVSVMDTPSSPQRGHVFVEGNDYNLWCFWSDGAQWHWTNMGKPSGVNLKATMGAVTVMDTPTSAQRGHVFVEGNDFNLWCRWSDGAQWHWINMGKPPGVNLRATMGAVTVMNTPTSSQRGHVFVEGNDYNLWCCWSDGAQWHWSNMGKPAGVNLRAAMGAVTVMDTPNSPQRGHVFVEGDDYNLWCCWSDGAQWHWTNMGKPPGVNLRATMGAVTVMNMSTSAQRGHFFVEGNDYNLWCCWSDGAQWQWSNMGKPLGVNLRARMGAVTVMDKPTSFQRGHVLVEGHDFNLWCNWLG